MNGQETQHPTGPYYNVSPHSQQSGQPQPPPPNKRKGDDESPGGGQRVSTQPKECNHLWPFPTWIQLSNSHRRNATGIFPLLAMSASAVRSNATASHHVNDAATCLSNACTRLIAATTASKTPCMCFFAFWKVVADASISEFRAMNAQISALQDQVNELYSHISALRGANAPYAVGPNVGQNESPVSYRGAMSPTRARGGHTQFQGPTSSAYNFDVAKSSLQTMGIAEPEMSEDGGRVEIDPALGAPHQQPAPMAPMVTQTYKDPLWQIPKDVAIRLCKVYDEEMGIMYPMLDKDKLITQTKSLFDFVDSARRTGLMRPDLPGADSLGGCDVDVIKMVLATALTIEGHGHSELGKTLYESCREAFESTVSKPVEVRGLILLVLVVSDEALSLRVTAHRILQAEYNFQRDEESQAYRFIGLATRFCLEIGIHHRQSLVQNFTNEKERAWVVRLFWSIYVLDRRWSLGVGRPFALQDADIDPALPQPVSITKALFPEYG